jgi:hypothetical protein
MLCKEDGVYKVGVNFEDIILTNSSSIDAENFLESSEIENVEAYLTIKIHETWDPDPITPYPHQRTPGTVREDGSLNVREHTFGPFPASERGFNIKSDFIIPGVKNSTFFKFLLTIVNKNTGTPIHAHLDTKLEPTSSRNVFGLANGIGFSEEVAATRFTNSVLTETWRVLDDNTLPYASPVNKHSISLLHIEKIAELPSVAENSIWASSTEETTGSGEKVIKSLKGVSRNVQGYYYNGDGIGTSNL